MSEIARELLVVALIGGGGSAAFCCLWVGVLILRGWKEGR